MAKKSTVANTSTTDLFIEEQLNDNYGLSTGEKVAIGFGIAGGAIILGFIIYEGIKYLITKHDNKYAAIPTQNVNPNMQQLPTHQYAQYIQTPPAPQSEQPQMYQRVPAPNGQVQDVPINPQHQQQPQPINVTLPPELTQYVQGTQTAIETLAGSMTEVFKAINIRNSQEFENLQNENAYLKQQVNTLMAEKERSDSFANHLMGQYDQLAMQTGAPLSREYLNNIYGNPAEGSIKYPNLNPNTPTNNIVR